MIDIVVITAGLQTPSALSVISLTFQLGNPCSIQGLSMSTHLCVFQTLAGPLSIQLYQAPVSKHFLESAIVSDLNDCIWN